MLLKLYIVKLKIKFSNPKEIHNGINKTQRMSLMATKIKLCKQKENYTTALTKLKEGL